MKIGRRGFLQSLALTLGSIGMGIKASLPNLVGETPNLHVPEPEVMVSAISAWWNGPTGWDGTKRVPGGKENMKFFGPYDEVN